MKPFFLTLFMVVIFSVAANAQVTKKIKENQVPKVVYMAFGQQFPDVKVMEWSYPDCSCYDEWEARWEQKIAEGEKLENYDIAEPQYFHVTYRYKNKDHRTMFYRNGDWVETKTRSLSSELPKVVTAAIDNSEYRDWQMSKYVTMVQKPLNDGKVETIYKVRMKGGVKRHLLQIYPDGTFVPKMQLLGSNE